MTLTTGSSLKLAADVPPKVKGPIRCHKCQMKCRDAEHYLSHKCEAASPPECLPYPTLTSRIRR